MFTQGSYSAYIPVLQAAEAVTSLKVEPGAAPAQRLVQERMAGCRGRSA